MPSDTPRSHMMLSVAALKALLLCRLDQPNTWLGHPIRMQRKSDFCCDGQAQWGHASASAALQRLGRRLSLSDGFRGCEEAASWQPDAYETLLHTFHLSTARPGHVGINNNEKGEHGSLGISFLFKRIFDMYQTYLLHLHYCFSWVTHTAC